MFEHLPGQLDAMHLDAAPAQRQADLPGPDRKLERPTITGERGQELDRGSIAAGWFIGSSGSS